MARQRAVLYRKGGKIVKVKDCINLAHNHKQYGNGNTIAIKYDKTWIGLEKLSWVKFHYPKVKAQWITPYTEEGRNKYEEITGKKFSTMYRNPFLTLADTSSLLAKNSKEGKMYTLEYFINRPMAFHRDKGKCKVCEIALTGFGDTEIHHVDPDLPLDKVNKVSNLVTLCKTCHISEHRIRRAIKAKKRKPATKVTKKILEDSTKRSRKPEKEKLLELVKTLPYTKIGEMYGVSDNAVKKWALGYGIHDLRLKKAPRVKN
jgi:hypothetical protein